MSAKELVCEYQGKNRSNTIVNFGSVIISFILFRFSIEMSKGIFVRFWRILFGNLQT